MTYINVYARLLKNKKNYNIIFTNFKYKISLILNINYNINFKINKILYLKDRKSVV